MESLGSRIGGIAGGEHVKVVEFDNMVDAAKCHARMLCPISSAVPLICSQASLDISITDQV